MTLDQILGLFYLAIQKNNSHRSPRQTTLPCDKNRKKLTFDSLNSNRCFLSCQTSTYYKHLTRTNFRAISKANRDSERFLSETLTSSLLEIIDLVQKLLNRTYTESKYLSHSYIRSIIDGKEISINETNGYNWQVLFIQ